MRFSFKQNGQKPAAASPAWLIRRTKATETQQAKIICTSASQSSIDPEQAFPMSDVVMLSLPSVRFYRLTQQGQRSLLQVGTMHLVMKQNAMTPEGEQIFWLSFPQGQGYIAIHASRKCKVMCLGSYLFKKQMQQQLHALGGDADKQQAHQQQEWLGIQISTSSQISRRRCEQFDSLLRQLTSYRVDERYSGRNIDEAFSSESAFNTEVESSTENFTQDLHQSHIPSIDALKPLLRPPLIISPNQGESECNDFQTLNQLLPQQPQQQPAESMQPSSQQPQPQPQPQFRQPIEMQQPSRVQQPQQLQTSQLQVPQHHLQHQMQSPDEPLQDDLTSNLNAMSVSHRSASPLQQFAQEQQNYHPHGENESHWIDSAAGRDRLSRSPRAAGGAAASSGFIQPPLASQLHSQLACHRLANRRDAPQHRSNHSVPALPSHAPPPAPSSIHSRQSSDSISSSHHPGSLSSGPAMRRPGSVLGSIENHHYNPLDLSVRPNSSPLSMTLTEQRLASQLPDEMALHQSSSLVSADSSCSEPLQHRFERKSFGVGVHPLAMSCSQQSQFQPQFQPPVQRSVSASSSHSLWRHNSLSRIPPPLPLWQKQTQQHQQQQQQSRLPPFSRDFSPSNASVTTTASRNSNSQFGNSPVGCAADPAEPRMDHASSALRSQTYAPSLASMHQTKPSQIHPRSVENNALNSQSYSHKASPMSLQHASPIPSVPQYTRVSQDSLHTINTDSTTSLGSDEFVSTRRSIRDRLTSDESQRSGLNSEIEDRNAAVPSHKSSSSQAPSDSVVQRTIANLAAQVAASKSRPDWRSFEQQPPHLSRPRSS